MYACMHACMYVCMSASVYSVAFFCDQVSPAPNQSEKPEKLQILQALRKLWKSKDPEGSRFRV